MRNRTSGADRIASRFRLSHARQWPISWATVAASSSSVSVLTSARATNSRGRTMPASAIIGIGPSISNAGIGEARLPSDASDRAPRIHTRTRRDACHQAHAPRAHAQASITTAAKASAASVTSKLSTASRGSYFQYDGRNSAATKIAETTAGERRMANQNRAAPVG